MQLPHSSLMSSNFAGLQCTQALYSFHWYFQQSLALYGKLLDNHGARWFVAVGYALFASFILCMRFVTDWCYYHLQSFTLRVAHRRGCEPCSYSSTLDGRLWYSGRLGGNSNPVLLRYCRFIFQWVYLTEHRFCMWERGGPDLGGIYQRILKP